MASVTGLYVGTSGFSYPTWRGGFYGDASRPKDFLREYSQRLPSVELNTTFYGLPAEEQIRDWAGQVPAEFRFAVKMAGRITHGGDLQRLATFLERVRLLGERLGPVLIQLPENRPRDDGLLHLLLGSVDPALAYALEFRHDSWDDPAVDEALDDALVARVNRLEGAASFRYLRLRETPYSERQLTEWAARIRSLLENRLPVYAYFRHEDEPHAPRHALRLRELVLSL
jgi:uncharacterized protein YecE (DUF72 family)